MPKQVRSFVPREITMSADHAQWIAAGRKTQTARLNWRLDVRVGAVLPITVIDRREAALHVKVTRLRYTRLGDLTEAAARAESCASLAEYRESWEHFTKTKWDPKARVVVVRFEHVPD
jgi:hypothetical protein